MSINIEVDTMRLTHIRIQNFRSIKDCSLNLSDFASLIGPNNSGKSTVLRAIEIFLNQTRPVLDDWYRIEKDKCIDESIIIEGTFEELQEWERNTPGVAGIVYENKIRLRIVARQEEDKKATGMRVDMVTEALGREEEIAGWAESWKDLDQTIKDIAQESGVQDGNAWRTASNKEKVKQKVRESYSHLINPGEVKWSKEHISIPAALQQALPQVVFIPAVRDAADDVKSGTRSPFGLLLSKVIVPAIEASPEYAEVRKAVEALAWRVQGKEAEQLEEVKRLMEELSRRMSSIIETKVIINLEAPDTTKFIGGASIRLDDGIETSIHMQGHGVQRSLIFALIEVLARREAELLREEGAPIQQRSTVLLFEEPELYMHPHLMRRLKTALIEISKSDNWQVVVSTHSPFLLDVANEPTSLIIMRKNTQHRTNSVKQLEKDPFLVAGELDDRAALRAALDFHPTVAEAFFAERVVLVEGDTEMAVFRHHERLLKLAQIDRKLSDHTTIVSCGGKWTIPAMARLLSAFGIPFRVIHDCDRKGLPDDELTKVPRLHPFRANEYIKQASNGAEIHIIEDTFEDILWEKDELPTTSGGGKPYQAWRRIQELCDGCDNLDHIPKLKEVILFAFDWG